MNRFTDSKLSVCRIVGFWLPETGTERHKGTEIETDR